MMGAGNMSCSMDFTGTRACTLNRCRSNIKIVLVFIFACTNLVVFALQVMAGSGVIVLPPSWGRQIVTFQLSCS